MIKYFMFLLLPLFLGGCAEVTPFELGQKEYVSGNYIGAAKIFAQHTSWNSDIKYEAMYYEGMCWLNLKNYDDAKTLFTNVIEHSDNRMIKAKAIAAKAEACLLTDDCQGAISLYRMLLLAGYGDSYPQDEAYEMLSKAAIQCGNTSVLDEFADRFGSVSGSPTNPSLVNNLKRVRIVTQFSSKDEAVMVMSSLKDSGIDTSLIKVTAPDSDYYIVQVGAFSNSENADRMAQKVLNAGWKVSVIE